MPSEIVRLFIAIELDDALREGLKCAQRQLQDEAVMRNVRRVAPQNIHLTLKFLGNSERGRVPVLMSSLERIAKTFVPFELIARGLGCFPNTRRPNNIWVGLEGDVKTTALLVQQVEEETNALGFARDERGFTPHLTIGRVKREASNRERAAIGEVVKGIPTATFGTIRAEKICLIASDLQPTGPVYTILAQTALRKGS